MAGVTADSVLVEVVARIDKYERDMERAAKKTEAAFARMRKASEAPISPNVSADGGRSADAVEKNETRKQRARQKTVETEAQAQARISAMVDASIRKYDEQAKAAERSAGAQQKATNRSLQAAQTRLMSTTSPRAVSQPTTNDYSRDMAYNNARLIGGAVGGDKAAAQALRDQQAQLRIINQLKKAGLSESEAIERSEQQIARAVKQRADNENRANREASRLGRSGGGIGGRISSLLPTALGAGSAIFAAKQFLDIADASKNLEAQLRLATQGFGSFAQAQEDVRRISTETRSDVQSTAQLYSNFTRNAKELGITQAEAARATETVAKAFAISGASATEASNATRQLVQGLQSGTLRGDELNSVLEQAPRLSSLLAGSLGVTVGELRNLGAEGKLTSQDLVKAFTDIKFTESLDREFQQLPVTFSQAMTLVYNSAVETFGAFDRGGQFSTALASFFADGADGFSSISDRAAQVGIEVRATFEGLKSAFQPMIDGAFAAFTSIESRANYTRDSIANLLGAVDSVRNFLPSLQNSANAFDRRVFGTQFQKDAPTSNMRQDFLKAFQAAEQRGKSNEQERKIRDFFSGYDIKGNPIVGTPKGGRPIAPTRTSPASGGSGASSAARAAEKAERERYRDEQNERRAQIEVIRARSDLTDSIEAQSDFQNQILQIERQSALAEIEADKSLSAKARDAALKRISILYGGASASGDTSVINAPGLYQQKEIQDRQRALARQADDAARSQYDINRDILQSAIDDSVTRKQRAKAQIDLLNLELEEKKRALELKKSQTNDAAQQSVIQGQINAIDGERSRGVAAINRQNEGPLARYARENANTEDLVEQAVVNQLDQVKDGITRTLEDAIGVKNPILSALLQQFIQTQIIGPILNGIGGIGGGGGIFGSLFGSIFGGGRAIGGPVSAGKIYRINENGPEFFQPAGNGKIIPTGKMRGMGGGGTVVQQTFVLDARYGVTTPQLIDYVNRTASAKAVQAASTVGKTVYQSIPQRMNEYNRDGV